MSDFLWVEKYRPQTIDECILPADTKEIFNGFLEKGEINNLLLAGTAGIGKTTIAKALCTQLGVCLLYTSPSPRDVEESRMPSSA